MVTNDGIPVYHGFRPALPGGIVAMRATVCEQVGPFDVTLMSAEGLRLLVACLCPGGHLRTATRRSHARAAPAEQPGSVSEVTQLRDSAVWLS